MKLYLIKQELNCDYDTYDAMIVCAKNEEEAKNITPTGNGWGDYWTNSCWVSSPNLVTATYIGEANENVEKGVVLASFNAG